MNKFKISIIVPVYNSEKYLSKCIKSVLNQTLDFKNNIEIILINDGSIDNSEKVCLKYKRLYPDNINYIAQQNQGVSTARNNGIKKAKGKYILFLDSDDYLSQNACQCIYNMFEKHYDEIDIITYPIVWKVNNESKKHPRYSKLYYKGTAIYDMREDYNLIQTTINICIKNKFKDNYLFKVDQSFSEDERFATQIIMEKQKIGFCKEATYYYRKHHGNATSTIINPYYTFDLVTSYYEMLFEKYKTNGHVTNYIQALYLSTLSWRIKQDVLLPYHLEGKEYDKAVNRIKSLIKQIDVQVISNFRDMKLYHKIYILELTNRKIDYSFEENKLKIYCEKVLLEEVERIKGYINKLKPKDDKLYIMCSVLNPIFSYKKPEIFLETISIDNKKESIKMQPYISNESYYMAKIKTTTAYSFETNIDYKYIKSFRFYIKIDNKKMNIKFTPRLFISNNFISKYKIILYSKKDSTFKLREKTFINLLKNKLRNFISSFKKEPKSIIYRFLYYIYNPKNVWIYTDRGDAVDNGYYQFKHDLQKKDNIKRYYICRFNEEQINNYFTEEEKKYIVKQNSLKHKLLFMHADKILTSFSDLQVYNPLYKCLKAYSDLLNYELIYLQHGILYAHLVKMYSKVFKEIDKIVISTTLEKNNLINIYQYNESDLICSGMSRMSQVEEVKNKTKSKKRKILFAPSWRAHLIGPLIDNKREINKIIFKESIFYKKTIELLKSKELNTLLEKNNIELDFKLHPIFVDYSDLFDFKDNQKINLKEGKTDFNEYSIFITDFSSFQFDFVKLKTPIIYFFPDLPEFRAGLHSYRELDLDLNNAFGKLCQNQEETIKEIQNIVNNNYKSEEKYIKNSKNLFFEIKDPCEKIYNAIK